MVYDEKAPVAAIKNENLAKARKRLSSSDLGFFKIHSEPKRIRLVQLKRRFPNGYLS